MSALLDGLNEAQQKAVTHREGPLLIVAGAGTGKTTVITRRIAWLIEQELATPEQILALTFTEKAAAEMEERVDFLLPYGYVDLQISTFHAFCERLLRDHGVHIGMSPDFHVFSELDVWLLMRRQFDRFDLSYYRPLGNPTKYLKTLLQHFSRAKDAGVTSDKYLALVEHMRANTDGVQADQTGSEEESRVAELAHAYHTYQMILQEQDACDFGDLILYVRQLLHQRPHIRQRLQNQYQFVLVDEFQDTNHAQYELIKFLLGPKQNITVVGDDDQAIYKFRGASLENILRFEEDFPSAARVVLTHNYRSAQAILDKAHQFIQANNPRRLEIQSELSKKLTATRDEPGRIEHLSCATEEEEVRTVIEKMMQIKQQRPETTWSDFAILVRSNTSGTAFAHALERARIPYQFLAMTGLYQKPIILDCLALLRAIDRPHESPSVYRLLTMPVWQIDPQTIAQLNHLCARKGKSLFEALSLARVFCSMDQAQLSQIDRVLQILQKLRLYAQTHTVTEVFVTALKQSGLIEHINSFTDQKKQEIFGLSQQFYARLIGFESRNDEKSLHAFLDEFQFERDAGEGGALSVDLDAGPELVRIMTVHAAKGLEFPYVFVVHLVDRKFPTQRRSDAIPLPTEFSGAPEANEQQFHLEEERRLFYVAMTRARDGLFLTSSVNYGGARSRKPSRFLDELGLTREGKTVSFTLELLDQDQQALCAPERLWNHAAYLPKQFSFTQLAAFKICPLQYKLAHILKVPILGKWTFSFGKTMHNTLHRYFLKWMERFGKRQTSLFEQSILSSQNELLVSEDEILELYESCWQDDWYPDDAKRETYRARGREQLLGYLKTFADCPPHPLFLEQGFTYKAGNAVLKGRIDRLDRFEDGVEIIDYKTGSPKTLVSLERDDKAQLYLYQLAVRDVLKLQPKQLTFFYLEDQSRVSFLASDEELGAFAQEIEESIQRIRKSAFPPTPGYHCRFCDFADICEYRASL